MGGHTPVPEYYGMAADSIEDINVVTADGKFITVTSKKSADLFWQCAVVVEAPLA